jgi:hypothetical protein
MYQAVLFEAAFSEAAVGVLRQQQNLPIRRPEGSASAG